MILPVLITDQYVSALLVDGEGDSFDIVGSSFFKISGSSNPTQPVLTKNSLIATLKKSFKNFPNDDDYKLIKVNLDDILDCCPIPHIFLDHYHFNNFNGWDQSDIDTYRNYVHYQIDIPKELKIPIDNKILIKEINNNMDALLTSNQVLVVTPGTSDIDHRTYIKELVSEFAQNVKIAGVWDFTLDDQVGIFPFLGVFKHFDFDIEEYFEKNPLKSDAKLVVAPGVREIEYTTEEGKTEKKTLEPNSITTIPIKSNKVAKFKWKSPKSKFEGELSGSEIGILIDNNDRGQDG